MIRYSLLTTHYSLLTTYYLLLTIHYSLLTTYLLRSEALHAALGALGLPEGDRTSLYSLVAATLHLADVHFEPKEEDDAIDAPSRRDIADGVSRVTPASTASLAAAASLVGLPNLADLLTSRVISSGGGGASAGKKASISHKPLSVADAERGRDAAARALYARAFAWVETRINASLHQLQPQQQQQGQEGAVGAEVGGGGAGGGGGSGGGLRRIDLLDIFGFEKYESGGNGFEQLCINYANEKLQQYFLTRVFKAEHEVYEAEGVLWPDVEFLDNEGCVDALDKVTRAGPLATYHFTY